MSVQPSVTGQVARPLLGERYLTAAGCTLLLWDHILTFPTEKRLMWKGPLTLHKTIFFVIRYGVTITQISVFYGLGGYTNLVASDAFCKGWAIYMVVMFMVSLMANNYVMTWRVYALWGHSKNALRILWVGFILAYGTTITLNLYNITRFFDNVVFEPFVFHMCIIQKSPATWPAIWGCQVAFDILVIIMTVWNAIDRPRNVNVALVTDLKRDGIAFFAILLALRLVNLSLSLIDADVTYYSFIALFFDWSVVTVTVTRLLLKLEAIIPQRLPLVYKGGGENGGFVSAWEVHNIAEVGQTMGVRQEVHELSVLR